MPSPLGHALGALAVHALTARDAAELRAGGRALLLVGVALAPDLDLVFRFVDGRNHHNNETHSLGAAVLAAVAAALVARWFGRAGAARLGVAAGLAWLSHVFLDLLNRDINPPIGVMALWPLSCDHFKLPWPILAAIGRRLTWESLWHNALAVAWEAVLLGALLVVVWRRRARSLGE
jgi:membrane-bound metal-dependent hydrolase YbcI (DUF457 family)